MDLALTSLMSPSASAIDLTSAADDHLVGDSARRASFSSILSKFGDGFEHLSPAEKSRSVAEEFVASSLIFPILKELRQSNNAWGPFAQGRHEETFGAMLDIEIASQIVRASNFPLVDRLARDLLRHQEGKAAPTSSQGAGVLDQED